jgi:hypothetical protein
MRESLPAMTLALGGLVTLAAIAVEPRSDTRALAIAVPVWADAGTMASMVERFDLAIVDLRLGGWLTVVRPANGFDARQLAGDLRRSLSAGSLVLAADAGLCATTPARP